MQFNNNKHLNYDWIINATGPSKHLSGPCKSGLIGSLISNGYATINNYGGVKTYFGWRSGFLVLCLIDLMALILSTFGLKESNKNSDPNAANIITILNNYRYLLTQRLFLAYSITIGLAWCAYYSFIQSSSFVFQSVFKVTPTVYYDAMYEIIIIGYIIGTTFTRRYSNKIGINHVIIYESFVALGSSILMLVLTYFNLGLILSILVPMTILMMGVGGIFPACQAAVMQPFTHIAGTASGLFFFIQMIFGAICGLILSSFHIDSQAPMVLTIVVSCLLLSLSSYLLPPQNRDILTSKEYSSESGSRNL
ncbi:MFS transporter [Priestia abyssalis]|uniref:MFS transporter n=1 Tax=Priestia abyssalis TaxID=1221450 RepID=UPI0009954927|nr:MFS transporter [Priestia abyssalis]